jgi:hypothetical protein
VSQQSRDHHAVCHKLEGVGGVGSYCER